MAIKTVFKVFEVVYSQPNPNSPIRAILFPMEQTMEGISYDSYDQADRAIETFPPGAYQIQKFKIVE